MYNFKNDYAEGAHPNILERLYRSNFEQHDGYGEDPYTAKAKNVMQEKMQNPNAAIFFVSGGTQANLLVISHLLRPHEAVISAKTGHIYANEAGAIEATGHRIIPVDKTDGKLNAEDVTTVLKQFAMRPHVVKPKMVYISNPTELGNIYTQKELADLSKACKENSLYLFLDGARLAHAICAKNSNLTLADISSLTDVFYIGATKNGGLLGEAIVFSDKKTAYEFDYSLKQKGALLAKGRLLGIQFLELFTDDLYLQLADHANKMAGKIAQALKEMGCLFLADSSTNQLFPIISKEVSKKLSTNYSFFTWREMGSNQEAIRLITSWSTDEKTVDQFITDYKALTESTKDKA